MLHLFSQLGQVVNGQSYWKVVLTSGKELSELGSKIDYFYDNQSGKVLSRRRKIAWLEDIVASGETRNIKEIHLMTPKGDACLHISEPYTAFQFQRGTSTWDGNRISNAHVIGRLDDKETGACTAVIWDNQEQWLYIDHKTNVRYFHTWREGAADVGKLYYEVVGLRGITD